MPPRRRSRQDDYDPYAAQQRRDGEPVSPPGPTVAPEKNVKVVADASKYGLFDGKTPSEILSISPRIRSNRAGFGWSPISWDSSASATTSISGQSIIRTRPGRRFTFPGATAGRRCCVNLAYGKGLSGSGPPRSS